MFPIKDIRQHVTNQLDSTVKVLRKHWDNSGIIVIKETAKKDDDDRKGKEEIDGKLLNEIKILSIPTNHVWVFENEFGHRQYDDISINTQKDAYMSAGKKVEKTIIFHQDNRFYIFMVEMKRSISPRKFEEDIAKKYEQSLATLSVFISAHFDFTHFEESKIFPIGICCYNYYKDTQPNYNRDKKWIAGSFRRKYEEGKREMLIPVNPLTLNVMQMPIVLCENLNDPITNSFEIDLEDILSRAISLSE